MAHGVTPESLERGARARRRTRAPRSSSRRPTTAWPPTSTGCAEVAHAAGVPLVVDQAWGPHFGFHPDLPPSALRARRRRGADLDAQDRRLAHAVGDAARRRRPAGSTPTRSARAVRLVRSTSPSSLLMASLDAARRQLARARRGAARRARSPRPRACARRSPPIPGCRRRRRRAWSAGPASRRWDPLRRRDRRPRHRLHRLRGGRGAARRLRHPGRARHARDDRARARHRRAGRASSSASRTTSRRPCGGIERPGELEALVRSPGSLENEIVVAPREAFLGEAEVVAVDDASRPRLAPRRSPATRRASPRCCRASGSPAR